MTRCSSPTSRKQRHGRREGVAVAGELQRQGHVLQRGHGRDEMEGLEQDADPIAPEQGEPVLVETAQIDAVDQHLAGGRPLDPADDRHQAGLAGARGAHHAYAGCRPRPARSMPRRIATGPAALGRVRCTSASSIIAKSRILRRRASVAGARRGDGSSVAGAARRWLAWLACCSSPWRRAAGLGLPAGGARRFAGRRLRRRRGRRLPGPARAGAARSAGSSARC